MEAYIQANALTVYAIVLVAAALLHWGLEVRKGRATADFIAYWFTDTPGYSLGTAGALVGAWWLVYTTRGLDGMAAHMVVETAFATGYVINSAVSPGSTTAARAVGVVVDKTSGFVRLSFLPLLLALAVAVTFVGCAQLGLAPLHQPAAAGTAVTPLLAAQNAIDEANATLTAVNKVIQTNVEGGVWTKTEAQGYLDRSKEYGRRVDQARAALAIGNLSDAQAQAQAAQALILVLQREIAAQARKEGN